MSLEQLLICIPTLGVLVSFPGPCENMGWLVVDTYGYSWMDSWDVVTQIKKCLSFRFNQLQKLRAISLQCRLAIQEQRANVDEMVNDFFKKISEGKADTINVFHIYCMDHICPARWHVVHFEIS